MIGLWPAEPTWHLDGAVRLDDIIERPRLRRPAQFRRGEQPVALSSVGTTLTARYASMSSPTFTSLVRSSAN